MPPHVRKTMSRLPPYVPGKPAEEVERELGVPGAIKLASNENPWGPSPRALAAAEAAIRRANLYPDASSHDLIAALSRKLDFPAANLVLGNGSDELITNLSLAMLEPGDKVVMGHPGFSRYEASALLAGAEVVKVPLDADAKHDLPAMADAARDARIVWIANPNNPTGTIVPRHALGEFLNATPEDTLVVLDEAYFEFVEDAEYPSSLDYAKDRPNVAGLRTFSKTYGLAGLRVGYGFFSASIADALRRVRQPFSVNSVAQSAALAALEDEEFLSNTVSRNREGLRSITQILLDAGARVAVSHANFVWAELDGADDICKSLLAEGVIVRPGRVFGMPHCLRVSVGTREEVDRFRVALSRVMEVAVR